MMTTPELIAAFKDIVLAIAGGTTAFLAWRGYKNWSRELHGKAAFETARSMSRATYRLRNAIEQCRAPLMEGGEFPPGFQSMNATAAQHADGYAYLFKNRWSSIWVALEEFDSQALEAEALWGEPIKSRTNALRQQINVLRAAVEAVIGNARSGGEDFTGDAAFAKNVRSTVWGVPGDANNEFAATLAKTIAGIENVLRPHLGAQR